MLVTTGIIVINENKISIKKIISEMYLSNHYCRYFLFKKYTNQRVLLVYSPLQKFIRLSTGYY